MLFHKAAPKKMKARIMVPVPANAVPAPAKPKRDSANKDDKSEGRGKRNSVPKGLL
jgi:hypothetical protein